MAGIKGKSGRKPSPHSKRKYIQVRVTEAQKEILQDMAETTQAGTISAVITELIDTQGRISQAKKGAGGANAYEAKG